MSNLSWPYPIALLLANLSLLLPDAHPLRIVGALLLIGLLPGLGWTDLLIAEGQAKGPAVSAPLARLTLATGLSYILTMLAGLLLHYLPGPVTNWQLLLCLDGIAFLGYILSGYAKIRFLQARLPRSNQNLREKIEPQKIYTCPTAGAGQNLRALTPEAFKIFPLLLILLISLLLRGVNLGYSEFQGDESLAMISAAESLEGHEDALFLRAKGPGEVLLPMALWRLTGTTNESIARLPFALAGLGAVVTLYLLGRELKNERLGWLAAGFFALNGFAVAFSRVVQYQILVLWFSSLAFWLAWHWRRSGQWRWVVTAGLCLGAGLLAHYDAVLVVPAIGWLLLAANRRQPAAESDNGRWPAVGSRLAAAGFFVVTLLFVALPFYLPYSLDPRANRTGEYVSDRIGSELRNNLPDFFHFNTFYSSSYYLILTGLLVFGLLAWFVAQKNKNKVGLKPTFIINGWRWGLAAVLVAGIIGIIVKPDLLAWDIRLDLLDWHKLNLSALPFGLLLLVAFVVTPMGDPEQALIAWLAVPFLGYNFVVALGLTHIYTTVPAWSLLAALAWDSFWTRMNTDRHGFLLKFSNTLLMGLLLTATVFLWNAFVRHDVEYWQDYPAGNLAFYWNPYPDLPRAGFFGFAHRAGWKTVGQKIAAGELSGDFGSNEEPDVTAWYTRGAPRACDPRPEFYFLADDLIDPVDTPNEIIGSAYTEIGAAKLSNGKGLRLMQLEPATLNLGRLDDTALAAAFDQTATPAAFARSVRGATAIGVVNFKNLVQLVGYNLDTRRAYPGGRVPVTLYWQALQPITASYQVFTHLESPAGPVAQADGAPVCWTYPTDRWQPGQIIADQHAVSLPADITPGEYPLYIGLYLAETGERLDVLDTAGNPAGTSVILETITVGSRRGSYDQ